jgi:hypothetical protein|nr:MAG TPA: hypothetical protein [Caudoviricetes sp.]
MKKIRLKVRVLDRITHEEVEVVVTRSISESLANAIVAEIGDGDKEYWKQERSGHGDDDSDLDMVSPLKDQERFHINPQFHVIEDNEADDIVLCGFSS